MVSSESTAAVPVKQAKYKIPARFAKKKTASSAPGAGSVGPASSAPHEAPAPKHAPVEALSGKERKGSAQSPEDQPHALSPTYTQLMVSLSPNHHNPTSSIASSGSHSGPAQVKTTESEGSESDRFQNFVMCYPWSQLVGYDEASICYRPIDTTGSSHHHHSLSFHRSPNPAAQTNPSTSTAASPPAFKTPPNHKISPSTIFSSPLSGNSDPALAGSPQSEHSAGTEVLKLPTIRLHFKSTNKPKLNNNNSKNKKTNQDNDNKKEKKNNIHIFELVVLTGKELIPPNSDPAAQSREESPEREREQPVVKENCEVIAKILHWCKLQTKQNGRRIFSQIKVYRLGSCLT